MLLASIGDETILYAMAAISIIIIYLFLMPISLLFTGIGIGIAGGFEANELFLSIGVASTLADSFAVIAGILSFFAAIYIMEKIVPVDYWFMD